MTFFTRRQIQKSWDCDSHELRLTLRLPRSYRFRGMQVSCSRVTLEYVHLDCPNQALVDTIDLQVPVRGDEGVHALREENGEEVLSLWVPRHRCTIPGRDPAVHPSAPCLPAWDKVAS